MSIPRLRTRSCGAERRGTTIVETALVLPVFLLFVLALVEFGHALMVKNVLRSACRAGARLGSTEGQSTSSVEQHVRRVLGGAVRADAVHISVRDASTFDNGGSIPENSNELESLPSVELLDAEPRQLFMVRARVNYNDVALLPMPFLKDVVLQGQSFTRHE